VNAVSTAIALEQRLLAAFDRILDRVAFHSRAQSVNTNAPRFTVSIVHVVRSFVVFAARTLMLATLANAWRAFASAAHFPRGRHPLAPDHDSDHAARTGCLAAQPTGQVTGQVVGKRE